MHNSSPSPTPTPISPSTIKKYIPVRNHLPTPIPNLSPSPMHTPTCVGMFDYGIFDNTTQK